MSRGYPLTKQIVARRRKEAEQRNQEYNTLTPQQKLEMLDRRLGKNIGAQNQRIKLQAQMELKATVKDLIEEVAIEETSQENKSKKIKAKDRRKQEQK